MSAMTGKSWDSQFVKSSQLTRSSDQSYKVLKISTHDDGDDSSEQQAYGYIASLQLDFERPGFQSLRQCLDMFDIVGPTGNKHHCFVHEPAACNVDQLWDGLAEGAFTLDQIKSFARRTLQALDFLHREAKVIHCDVKPENLLLPIRDPKALTLIAETFTKQETEVKYVGDSKLPVYESIGFENIDQSAWGHPVLGDLGEAAIIRDDPEYGEWLVPRFVGAAPLRPPESVLGTLWNCTVDIWMTGCMVSHDLLCQSFGCKLTTATDPLDDRESAPLQA